jgi:hypothetical protein
VSHGCLITHGANRGDRGYDACAQEIDQGSQREDKQRHIRGSDRSPPCNGRVSRSALRMCRWRPFPERDGCVGERSLPVRSGKGPRISVSCGGRSILAFSSLASFFSVTLCPMTLSLAVDDGLRSLEEGLVCHGWRSE